MNLDLLVRENIRKLKPYSSARSEFTGEAHIYLDANENPFETGFNRYPDPLQKVLKSQIAEWKSVRKEQLFLGNGSDEAIDLLLRIFCEPGRDNILTLPPTYGMYKVSAAICDVEVKTVELNDGFQPDVDGILNEVDDQTKIIFFCSPNNPTGNDIEQNAVLEVAKAFKGIVVVDEAYIDFSAQDSLTKKLDKFSNLVILQTFSKAMGLAGIRLGMAFASEKIIDYFNKVKPPYNVNQLTQDAAIMALENLEESEEWVQQILAARNTLIENMNDFSFVQKVHPSNANFILVKVDQPNVLYNYLVSQGVIVRNRSTVAKCEGCLRFTIGTEGENSWLLETLKDFEIQLPE